MPEVQVDVEQVWTFDELWIQACRTSNRMIPRNTFRDWITKVCKLNLKQEYSSQDWAWIAEWIEFQRKYPRRSTVKVKRFHEYMEKQQCQN